MTELTSFYQKVYDCIVTFAETWNERHAIAYGIFLVLAPWHWFNLDECWVPKSYPYDVRIAIYGDFHYYVFGTVIPIIIMLLMIWIYLLMH